MTGPVPAGLRLAIAMFTGLPVPRDWNAEEATRARARAALAWLPLVGAVLGSLAGLGAAAVLGRSAGAGTLAATVAVALLALLTRGLHLDGLADTTDGLGSRAPAERALAIMRQSDIGPFGVMALVLVLGLDVAALSAPGVHAGSWTPVAALAVAAATGRVAVVHAAARGVPSARPSGFGAIVAGVVPRTGALAVTAVTVAGGAALAAAVHRDPLAWGCAQVAALAVVFVLARLVIRRLGGVTGDVFGALVEVTTALTLIGLALG